MDVPPALLARARTGDPDAVGDLLVIVRKGVLRFTRARLATYEGGSETAEDVTQMACLAVADILPRFTPITDDDDDISFQALVYRIAANKVVDAQRRYSRVPDHIVEELPEQTEPAPGPERQMLASFDVARANALIDSAVDERTARIVRLRAQGFTPVEVAQLLGLSAGVVRVAHCRGLKKIRARVA